MYWIALQPSNDEERSAWSWRALQFTPRVAWVDEALLLEASGSLRLWGGRRRLLEQLLLHSEPLQSCRWADAPTSLKALGLLRLRRDPAAVRLRHDDMPLPTLSAAREHVATLERIGCRTWGDVRRLPRAGVARRFGASFVEALDAAYGERPERYRWEELPEVFDRKIELPSLATGAPELLWAAQRLLAQLQVWLQARHRGVLALELEWTLDLRRLDGVVLPSHQQLPVRTAQPTQDVAHLCRLVGEHLARTSLAAPANHLRLRSIETVPWAGLSKSLLPEDHASGEALHQLIERLSVRLGADNVLMPSLHADHRPECMQAWQAAHARTKASSSRQVLPRDAIYPAWLLREPLRLEMHAEKPQYQGPLRLLVGPQRLETGWWDGAAQGPAVRDYFIARSEQAGLLWIYRERLVTPSADETPHVSVRWYLQGVYA
jgi:protein ImuB